jgi:uncharacterized OsmC-like protein
MKTLRLARYSAAAKHPDPTHFARNPPMNDVAAPPKSAAKVYLKPIDKDGLAAFAKKGRENSGSRGTMKAHTVADGQFRNLTYIGNHAPVVVDEPLHLFGQDTAPAPSEALLAALGACLSVGIQAVATWKNVPITKLELFLEGDIGNPAAWGAGGADKQSKEMGFQEVRVKVVLEGDAPRETLDEIVRHANFYSPVANSYRNPIPMTVSLV